MLEGEGVDGGKFVGVHIADRPLDRRVPRFDGLQEHTMASATPQIDPSSPLTSGTPRSLIPQPCTLVISGAAGDLSWRKLLPAVYNLNVDGVLPAYFAVVGFGMKPDGPIEGDKDEYIRERAKDGIEKNSPS